MSDKPAPPRSKAAEVQAQVDEVKGIMGENIDTMLRNHEKAEILQDKTEGLAQNASAFKRSAVTLRRTMWWKNTKLLIIIGAVIVLVIVVIVVIILIATKKKS